MSDEIPQSKNPRDDHKAIDYIMKNFNWAKVVDAMHRLNWEWAMSCGVCLLSMKYKTQRVVI